MAHFAMKLNEISTLKFCFMFGRKFKARNISSLVMNEFGQVKRIYRHSLDFSIEISSIFSTNWTMLGEKFLVSFYCRC